MAELANRSSLEQSFARDLGSLSERQRQELLRLMGSPPDPRKVPQSFWDQVDRENREKLAALLFAIFILSAIQHGMDDSAAAVAGERWVQDRVNDIVPRMTDNSQQALDRAAIEWEQRRREAAERVEQELRRRNQEIEDARREFEEELGRINRPGAEEPEGRGPETPPPRPPEPPADEPLTDDEIETQAEEAANDAVTDEDAEDVANTIFGPNRVDDIAVTETTVAASAGGEEAVSSTVGTSMQDVWRTERDARVCSICFPLQGTYRTEWQDQFPSGPPAHPRCRCWIEYENLRGPDQAT